MKKVFLALAITIAFISCRKETTEGADIPNFKERLQGKWNIVDVKYNGIAKFPFDTTSLYSFDGIGESVLGYYDFDSVPDPDRMDFVMSFTAPIQLQGASLNYEVNEAGYAEYSINEDQGVIDGVSYVIDSNTGDTTEVPSSWTVLVNEETRQVWSISRTYYWDFDPNYPIDIDMTTTIVR